MFRLAPEAIYDIEDCVSERVGGSCMFGKSYFSPAEMLASMADVIAFMPQNSVKRILFANHMNKICDKCKRNKKQGTKNTVSGNIPKDTDNWIGEIPNFVHRPFPYRTVLVKATARPRMRRSFISSPQKVRGRK